MKNFIKKYWLKTLKVIILILLLCFLVTAIVLGIIIWANCNNKDFTNQCNSLGVVATVFGTISIGMLPLYIFINNQIVNNIEILRKDKDNTVTELHLFTDTLSSEKTKFVLRVLNQFNKFYNLERFEKEFFASDKEVVCNNMENAILSINQNWPQKLLECIVNNVEFLCSTDTMCSIKSDSKKLDMFIHYLYCLLNKCEVYAYNFVSIRVRPEIYETEESPFIEDIYFKSYFLLTKTQNNNNYPFIDFACDIIKGGK